MPIRFDFIFSYFIFVWFLFYYFGYIIYCPNSWFILGIINNLVALSLMIFYKNPLINIVVFCIINTCIKIIPLWLLRNKPYKIEDFIFGTILFTIFSLWLSINKTNFIKVTEQIIKKYKEKLPATPLEYYIIKTIKKQ